jgi:hypothetical protein
MPADGRWDLTRRLKGNKMYVWDSVQLLSETFLILRRIKRDIILTAYWSSSIVPFIIDRFE